jgi:hypothetical protein
MPTDEKDRIQKLLEWYQALEVYSIDALNTEIKGRE